MVRPDSDGAAGYFEVGRLAGEILHCKRKCGRGWEKLRLSITFAHLSAEVDGLTADTIHFVSPCLTRGLAILHAVSGNHSSHKSRQSGLSASISANFHWRFHFMTNFSRAIAGTISSHNGSIQGLIDLMPYD
jgi:hypothetical protein